MCGIIGYLGKEPAMPVLLEGLRRLEYRGYDSAGIALEPEKDGDIISIRSIGKIKNLEEKIKATPGNEDFSKLHTGIAHTRWATHGVPSEENAHPQFDDSRKVYLVHNGIIENYSKLRQRLIDKGHKFASETDTEVIAQLIADLYQGDFKAAFVQALGLLKGAYAIVAMHQDEPGRLMASRLGSPMVLGLGDNATYIASDVSALVTHTRNAVYMNDGEVADITPSGVRVFNREDNEVTKKVQEVEWDISQAEKGGFEHFMLKEIMEQPETLANTLRGRLDEERGNVNLGGLKSVEDHLRQITKIKIVVCGTARHAGLIGQYMFEELCGLNTEVDYASEFRYRSLVWDEKTAVIAISQSGETADTLAAVREAREKGALTLGIINTVGSSIARETDAGVYNHIGPEISVASTKAFTSQLAVLLMMAIRFGRQRKLTLSRGREIVQKLKTIPQLLEKVLKLDDQIIKIAEKYKDYKHFGYIGRKYCFPLALEGALKLKEISYIHAEGWPSGELKHGSIALIDKDFPTFAIAPWDSVYEKNSSNIQEIRSRGGKIIALCTEGRQELKDLVDEIIEIPDVDEIFLPIVASIPLQLFAYHVSRLKGLDVDKPRNLAKSVTVE